jgi:hypothetical protein
MQDGLYVFSIQAKNIVAYLLAECASIFVRFERNSEKQCRKQILVRVFPKQGFHAEKVRAKPDQVTYS